jgi:hypothetical protein
MRQTHAKFINVEAYSTQSKQKRYSLGELEPEDEPLSASPVYGGSVRLCFTNNFSLNTANRVSH